MLAMIQDGPRPSIKTEVSDLFFNLDLSGCIVTKDRVFQGYDAGKLRAEAEWFTEALGRLGVAAGHPDDIVQDFLHRV